LDKPAAECTTGGVRLIRLSVSNSSKIGLCRTPNPVSAAVDFSSLRADPSAYDSSHILVRFNAETGTADTIRGLQAAVPLPGTELGPSLTLVPGLREVCLDPGETIEAALAEYRNDPQVVYAEPDYTVTAQLTPSDPMFSSLYGMQNIHAPAAWDNTTGSGRTIVAVIDTGIDYNHPDLYLNVWINQANIPSTVRAQLLDVDGDGAITFCALNDPRNIGPGKITDLNGDGRIDAGDILMPIAKGGWSTGPTDDLIGWDFANNDNNPMDDNGHGTHVSGTIGAVGSNGVGVVGVNWTCQLMALKFLNANGSGSTSAAISALNLAVANGRSFPTTAGAAERFRSPCRMPSIAPG
jgi:serine protease